MPGLRKAELGARPEHARARRVINRHLTFFELSTAYLYIRYYRQIKFLLTSQIIGYTKDSRGFTLLRAQPEDTEDRDQRQPRDPAPRTITRQTGGKR